MNPKLTQLRWIRVGAILVSLILPFLISLLRSDGEMSVLSIFYPSLRRVMLVGALGFQLFRIFKPDGAGSARTVVLTDSTVGHELGLAFLSLVLIHGVGFGHWPGVPQVALPFFFYGADILSVLLLVAWRGTTIIDGDAGTVRRFHFIPTSVPFGSIKGLGTFETRFMRAGRHVGSGFALALFTNAGAKPWILESAPSVADVQQRIMQLHSATGVPIAMR